MDINWLGHSSFRIRGRRTTVITDPYSPEYGYSLGKPTAQVVTVSHDHPGHSYAQGVGGVHKVVKGPGEYEIGGVLVMGIATFHDTERGAKLGRNTVYLMDVDEVSVCHLGDLGHVLTADHVEQLDNVDVLLVPVGGVATVGAAAAAEIVRQLEPKLVVPMHYQTNVLDRGLAPVEGFLKEMGLKDLIPQPRLSITRASLPQSTQVCLLEY